MQRETKMGGRPNIECAIENTRREIENIRKFRENLSGPDELAFRYVEIIEERLRQQLLSLQRMLREH